MSYESENKSIFFLLLLHVIKFKIDLIELSLIQLYSHNMIFIKLDHLLIVWLELECVCLYFLKQEPWVCVCVCYGDTRQTVMYHHVYIVRNELHLHSLV